MEFAPLGGALLATLSQAGFVLHMHLEPWLGLCVLAASSFQGLPCLWQQIAEELRRGETKRTEQLRTLGLSSLKEAS